MSCNTRLIPLYKVVAEAMMDAYSDISKAGVQQMFQHWAVRGFKKISNEVLPSKPQKALIYINPNTKTGTLPPDFGGLLFAGLINNCGEKVPVRLKSNIADTSNIQDLTVCEDKCDKCNQNKAICQDLTVTEDTVIKVINGQNYEQTIIKKLYPDGRYYLETRIPILNLETQVVEYLTQKEFVTQLDLRDCGCIEESESNIAAIQCNCPDVYCSYFAPCCGVQDIGYQIFEETGLIKFTPNFPFNVAYIEYVGFLPKKNGQYYVPEVSMECLIEWIKFKEVDGKKNMLGEKRWRLEQFKRERANMEKVIGSNMSLDMIMDIFNRTPKFDWYTPEECVTGKNPTSSSVMSGITDPVVSAGGTTSTPSVPATTPTTPTVPATTKQWVPFSIAVTAGNGTGTPTPGTNTYQNDKLKGALGLQGFIIVNNNNETKTPEEYTINTDTGVLTRYQGDGVTANDWQSGDDLIIPTFYKYI